MKAKKEEEREESGGSKLSWLCCCGTPVTSGAPLKHQTLTQRILAPWCHPGVVCTWGLAAFAADMSSA